ncbi:MAG: Spy0128 family protein [Aristaeellaceae bacterium]
MKPRFTRILTALICALLCLSAWSCALAADDLSVSLDVQITQEGTLPDPAEIMIVRITAGGSKYPMPDGQVGGTYDLEVAGGSTATFPAMTFTKLGIYTYTIEQLPGSDPDCAYDTRVYQLTVSIINAKGGGFDMEVALREQGKDEKLGAVLFHNVYKTIVPTPAPTKKPGDITATGVNDLWPYYFGGCALLLVIAGMAFRALRRKEEPDPDDDEA